MINSSVFLKTPKTINSLNSLPSMKTLSSPNSEKSIKLLSNEALHQNLKYFVQKEREILSEILLHLQEINRRKLHLEMGFCSLYQYMTEALNYSAASAIRRIDAARIITEAPEILQKIESGEVNLSQVSQVAQFARTAEKIHQSKVAIELKRKILNQLTGKNKHESEQLITSELNIPVINHSQEKHQADESVRVEMTFTKSEWAEIQKMRDIISHSVSGDLKEAILYLSEKVLAKQVKDLAAKQVRNQNAKQDFSATYSASEVTLKKSQEILKAEIQESTVGKTEALLATCEAMPPREEVRACEGIPARKAVPADIRRKVFNKYQSCQYRDPKTNRQCESHKYLQIEHRQPIWANGTNHIDNLTLLCRAHNLLQYQRQAMIIS